ncbi:MAG: DUF58 domain-containing protein [Ardenticatenales bacterium]
MIERVRTALASRRRPAIPDAGRRDDQGPPIARPDGAALRFDDAFMRRLERLALRVRQVAPAVGARTGRRRTPAADFVDHRAYSPGDDLRHIDWPALARHDAVFVKLGRVAQAAEVRILLDVSPSMAASARKWRLSLELAAALGWLGLARGDRVVVSPWPPGPTAPWGPAAGAARASGLLSYLSALDPHPATMTALAPAVRTLVRDASGGALIVISDLWRVDDLDRALAFAPRTRWDRSLLQILDPRELRPTADGPVALIDSETGERLTLQLDDELCDAYVSALRVRLDRLAGRCAAAGAGWALLNADWPLEQAVIPHLRHRGMVE